MTIVPVKERLENIMNIPMTLSEKLVRILAQNEDERSWEDVTLLQKATWKISDSHTRSLIDKAVSDSYDVRYGREVARQDASGRVINSEKEWKPKENPVSKNIIEIGIKLRKLAQKETNENIFSGLERGINILLGKGSKHIKISGSFNDNSQKIFADYLSKKPFPKVLDAIKTGLITDCVLGYQNRDLRTDEKKDKLSNILKVFDKTTQEDTNEDIELEEDNFENNKSNPNSNKSENISETEIKGVLWHSQDSCNECAENNGKFFALEEVPSTHPNCLCTTEVVTENIPYMRIYVKNNKIGHVRIEIVDAKGNRTIRGLNNNWLQKGDGTIYEKGEKDSSGISIDDKKQYLPSKKILLTQEEYDKAHKRIEELDKHNPKYKSVLYNCDDFVIDIIKHSTFNEDLNKYFSTMQKINLSSGSNLIKYKIPDYIGYPHEIDDNKPILTDDDVKIIK